MTDLDPTATNAMSNKDHKAFLKLADTGRTEHIDRTLQAHPEWIEIAKDLAGHTALHLAAGRGHASTVEHLLKAAGADVNVKDFLGATPLHLAAEYGHNHVVEVLIGAGADINVADSHGYTAMHEAALNGQTSVVPILRAAGAFVTCKDAHGDTPLHCAVSHGFPETVTALLEAGSELPQTNLKGKTAKDVDRAVHTHQSDFEAAVGAL